MIRSVTVSSLKLQSGKMSAPFTHHVYVALPQHFYHEILCKPANQQSGTISHFSHKIYRKHEFENKTTDLFHQKKTYWDHPVGEVSIFWHLHCSQHCQVNVTPKDNDKTDEDSRLTWRSVFNSWTVNFVKTKIFAVRNTQYTLQFLLFFLGSRTCDNSLGLWVFLKLDPTYSHSSCTI